MATLSLVGVQDETVEKACETCGAKAVSHRVHHIIRRLPRVLVLHLKRFQVPPPPLLRPCPALSRQAAFALAARRSVREPLQAAFQSGPEPHQLSEGGPVCSNFSILHRPQSGRRRVEPGTLLWIWIMRSMRPSAAPPLGALQAELMPGSAAPRLRKLHSRVVMPPTLQLAMLADGATKPPLPPGPPPEALPASPAAAGAASLGPAATRCTGGRNIIPSQSASNPIVIPQTQ